jgi:hypothetical protein
MQANHHGSEVASEFYEEVLKSLTLREEIRISIKAKNVLFALANYL